MASPKNPRPRRRTRNVGCPTSVARARHIPARESNRRAPRQFHPSNDSPQLSASNSCADGKTFSHQRDCFRPPREICAFQKSTRGSAPFPHRCPRPATWAATRPCARERGVEREQPQIRAAKLETWNAKSKESATGRQDADTKTEWRKARTRKFDTFFRMHRLTCRAHALASRGRRFLQMFVAVRGPEGIALVRSRLVVTAVRGRDASLCRR